MFVPFETVRQEALLSLYRLIYSSDNQEYFTKQDISYRSSVPVGSVFFGRALRALSDKSLVIVSSSDDGEDFFTLTNSGWEAAEKLALSMLTDEVIVEGVPASDRIVQVSDNQRAELHDAMDGIVSEIKASNEIGAALGDSRNRIEAELEAGRRLLRPNSVRVGAIVALIATPLRYLAEKFSGGAVGELAKKLMDLLWDLMNK